MVPLKPFLLLWIFCGSLFGSEPFARTKTNLNLAWKFHSGELASVPLGRDFDDSQWEVVSIPHTYRLTTLNLDAIKMKEAGINIVRLAHYPHDDSFLQACDELGLLVAEEPPTWIHIGPEIWMDRLEEATRRMIRNHRNHPSVWGWGGGINHRGPVVRLHLACKEEDPYRITMNNGTLWTGPQHSGVTDLYAVMDYRGAVVPPGEFLFGMEHSGTPNVEGQQRLISRYKAEPARIALAAWCGHDGYSLIKRGKEVPNMSVWKAALWDIHREPKPSYFWYQTELLYEPLVHIPDDRAQADDLLRVFSNCEEVELIADGVSLGRQKVKAPEKMEHLKSPPFLFPISGDRPAHLVAKGYRDGKVVATHERKQAGEAKTIELRFELDGFTGEADGSSILLAKAEIVDQHGVRVETSKTPVTFSVTGPGKIIDAPHTKLNPAQTNDGLAVILVRVGQDPGELILTANAEGLQSASATVSLKAYNENFFARTLKPFQDPLHLKLDLGNSEQHREDLWTAWSQDEGNKATFTVENGTTVTLETDAAKPYWRNTFGIPGDLSFLIEDGLEIEAGENITLRFENLPAGNYRLRTWHHRLSGERAQAPGLVFTSNLKNAVLPKGYQPSFGKKIQVSEAGGGNAGDGGSNLGAESFAECRFSFVDGQKNEFKLQIASKANKGKIAFNGLELLEE